MNYTRQMHGESYVYPVPPGLHELVNDISREVLRHQPENIHKFIADYLESLMRIREAMHVGVKFRAEVLDESSKFVNHLLLCGFSSVDLDAAATLIQSVWRGFLVRLQFDKDLERKRREREQAEENARAIAEDLNVTLPELVDATNVIQENFNDYLDRMLQGRLSQWAIGYLWTLEIVSCLDLNFYPSPISIKIINKSLK